MIPLDLGAVRDLLTGGVFHRMQVHIVRFDVWAISRVVNPQESRLA